MFFGKILLTNIFIQT